MRGRNFRCANNKCYSYAIARQSVVAFAVYGRNFCFEKLSKILYLLTCFKIYKIVIHIFYKYIFLNKAICNIYHLKKNSKIHIPINEPLLIWSITKLWQQRCTIDKPWHTVCHINIHSCAAALTCQQFASEEIKLANSNLLPALGRKFDTQNI